MGMPHPVSLPPGFHWEVVESGLQLHAGGISVLEVTRQRMGWVVRINVPGRAQYARTLAVGSEVAGVRFGNKWARSHKELLDLSQPMGGRAAGATPALPEAAQAVLKERGALPACLELIDTLDEIHSLREQLDAAMDRIEAALGEVMRQVGGAGEPRRADDAAPGDGDDDLEGCRREEDDVSA